MEIVLLLDVEPMQTQQSARKWIFLNIVGNIIGVAGLILLIFGLLQDFGILPNAKSALANLFNTHPSSLNWFSLPNWGWQIHLAIIGGGLVTIFLSK